MKKLILIPVLIFSFLSFSWGQKSNTPPANQSTEKAEIQKPKSKVSFTLRNNSLKSIPLIIPTVMNPNLSPNSNSGVTLKMGQKILFKAKGKKRILLVVDESIKNGDVIEVSKLLKERKEELNLR